MAYRIVTDTCCDFPTEMYKELGRSPTEEEVTERLVQIYLDSLGMRDAFDRVMADLDTAIPKILRHSASTDASALKANKVQILLGLTYLVRYYGFEVGGIAAKDVLLYSPEAVGGTSTQDALTTLTGLGENLSPTRSNGLRSMIKQMKLYALVLAEKQKA